ncbi:MAG: T9SS type A sorting domain-containing protein [Bacteroidia bacterium]
MKRKHLLLTLLLVLTISFAWAQRYEVTNYGNSAGAYGMTYDSRGNLWVSNSGEHNIAYFDNDDKRKVAAGGVNNPGYVDGQGVGMRFDSPKGILAIERGGVEVLAVCDAGNNVIRFLNISSLTTITSTKATDVGGFNDPSDIEADASGNVYVADRQNYVIKKIDATGSVTIVAGQAGVSGSANGDALTKATFTSPTGLYIDGSDIYVADGTALRKISDGKVTTIDLEPDFGWSYNLGGIFNATDLEKIGNTWVMSDGCTIRTWDEGDKYFTVFAGSGFANDCGNAVDVKDTFARFQTVYQLLYNEDNGTIYAADYGNNKIRSIAMGGVSVSEKTLKSTVLYPNPSNGQFFIKGLDANKGNQVSVSVINITGKIVYTQNHRINGDQVAINLNEFNSGLYLVTMAIGNEVVTKKMYVK